MALIKDRVNRIPTDAVILSEDEALIYQTKIIKKWKHTRDVLGFKIGPYILGGSSFLVGYYVNNYYRRKFKLFHYGRLSSYLPICIIPTLLSSITHLQFVMKDILLQKQGNCPICIQLRASAFQSFFGCVFPAILGPIAAMAISHKYATYDVPFITNEPKKVFQLLKKFTLPLSNKYLAIFIGQALLASTVVYFEEKSVYTVNMKLAILERELVEGEKSNS